MSIHLPVDVAVGRALHSTLAERVPDMDSADRTALANAMNAAVREHVNRAQAEVANAFVAWAAANEIAEPPLDWAWFGEIASRYSPLHEDHGTPPGSPTSSGGGV